jgi:hypothetical protein
MKIDLLYEERADSDRGVSRVSVLGRPAIMQTAYAQKPEVTRVDLSGVGRSGRLCVSLRPEQPGQWTAGAKEVVKCSAVWTVHASGFDRSGHLGLYIRR